MSGTLPTQAFDLPHSNQSDAFPLLRPLLRLGEGESLRAGSDAHHGVVTFAKARRDRAARCCYVLRLPRHCEGDAVGLQHRRRLRSDPDRGSSDGAPRGGRGNFEQPLWFRGPVANGLQGCSDPLLPDGDCRDDHVMVAGQWTAASCSRPRRLIIFERGGRISQDCHDHGSDDDGKHNGGPTHAVTRTQFDYPNELSAARLVPFV